MKKIICIFMSVFIFFTFNTVNVNADDKHPEVELGGGYYKGYDLQCSRNGSSDNPNNHICWRLERNTTREYYIYQVPVLFNQNLNGIIRIPNTWNGKKIHYIEGSCRLEAFDLDPENEYMKCVDNVIFSRDGKKLMSFARSDKRDDYSIPEGTEVIGYGAFFNCNNLKAVTIPDSICEIGERAFMYDNCTAYDLPSNVEVIPKYCFYENENLKDFRISEKSKLNKIDDYAFCGCEQLSEIWLPSFEISIARHAFAYDYSESREVALKSYVMPRVTAEGDCIKWDKIPGASYYEIYQKLENGEYKLIKTTKGSSCKFSSLKPEKEYIFAVKPFAVIDSEDGDEGILHHECPDTFTIEGTMSEDITVRG